MSEYVAKLEQENRRLRTSVKKEVADNYDRLISKIDELKDINKILEDAVKFYGDSNNCDTIQKVGKVFYHADSEQVDIGLPVNILIVGKKARQAQKQVEEIRNNYDNTRSE